MKNENSSKEKVDKPQNNQKEVSKIKKGEEWHRHPVFILILGFLLSTVLGGIITHQLAIQKDELLKKEKRLEKKIGLINEYSLKLNNYLDAVTKLIHEYYIYYESSSKNGPEYFERLRTDYMNDYEKWKSTERNNKTEIGIYFNESENVERLLTDINLLYDSRNSPLDSSIHIIALNLLLSKRESLNTERGKIEDLTSKIAENRNSIKLKLDTILHLFSNEIKESQ